MLRFIYCTNQLYISIKLTLKKRTHTGAALVDQSVMSLPVSINTCSCGLEDRDLSTAHLLMIEDPACSFNARQVRLI